MKHTRHSNYIQYEKRILDAFIHLCKKNNWSEPSITDIVKEAKVTRPTFYLHFKSIDEIYRKLKDMLTQKYVSYYSNDLRKRSADILQSNIELTNIIKENLDMFKCFIYSNRYEQYVHELFGKIMEVTTSDQRIKKYYDKEDESIGWWDWLNSFTIIKTHFEIVASMIKGEFEIDYNLLTYWCSDLAYKIIGKTWQRLGIKLVKHDYLKEYLDKKNKK